jgi:hypothetical protein
MNQMVCQNCSSANPDGQTFCGNCGNRLTAETIGTLADRIVKLEDRVRDISRKSISAHNLEVETAENVMARVRKWTTLILYFAGIPFAITLLALAIIFGKDTFEIRHIAANAQTSINEVLNQAQSEAANAKKTADIASSKAQQINTEITNTEQSVLKLKSQVDARSEDVQNLGSQLNTSQQKLAGLVTQANSQEAQLNRISDQVTAIKTGRGVADIQTVYPIYGQHIARSSTGYINASSKPVDALYLDLNLSLTKAIEISDSKAGQAVADLRDNHYTVTVGPVYMEARTANSAQNVGYALDSNSCMYWLKPYSHPPCILYFKPSLRDAAERVRSLLKVAQVIPENHVLYVDPAALDPQQRELLNLSVIDFEVVLGSDGS